MKNIFLFILFPFCVANLSAQDNLRMQVGATIDAWHTAAADANYQTYFDVFTDDAVFIGTDAGERWTKSDFQSYAKPYFDKGEAWSFYALERHVYFSDDKTIAWFDELLDTRMKLCRGSGILIFLNGQWKIKHYVLSMTVPNDNSDEVIKIKAPIEDIIIKNLYTRKR